MRRGGPKYDDARRRELAGAFTSGGEHYDRVRPGYPPEALAWILPEGARTAVDLGAGTGKFTQLLVAAGLEATAVDPSEDMLAQLARQLPGVRCVVAPAEHTGLPDACADVVVAAQAWHWFETGAATREAARLLRPGGRVGLVWNQLDTQVPWVHRLSRIMHAGDVHKPDYHPPSGPELRGWESLEIRWEDRITPEGIVELAKSRSYYLRASEKHRRKVEDNLAWYLLEHLGHSWGDVLALPYVAQAWRARAAHGLEGSHAPE
ncbi:ubiquinone biosynthesis protein [Sinomonas cellulolyticus]|uniref:Class I SAM-dependent methyltransferase n=1 Tax=Sinomonas cellulolyticus TaxID=2801916 RepID=A0ABS1K5C3_9MICC|nr:MULTISPECIES: class I SAM-dependent methyltransferase [Sinomonas]MBL0706562.1 class I SAM-dependent methyltransferase [Sinomonas cellulolyticus]GHG45286.1 ubiquinone biosynthesis protein [Sinomonas sp. KCTC 49339]